MTDVTLTDSVRSLVADALQVPAEAITSELEFGGIKQWDSMGHMEIMLRLEAQFGVEVSEETITALTSVPLICAHLEKKD
jgi:acyl carrier protein